MATLKNEFKMVKSPKQLTDLIKAQKNSARGIFAMHRNVMSLYIVDNKEYFEEGVLMVEGRINPTVKQLKDKSFKPFQLLYGLFTLDKVLKTINGKDFLSFMELYNKAVLTFIASDDNEQAQILERGAVINKAVQAFKLEQINGIEFINVLFEYFPSFYEGLKNDKIKPNVAKFLFDKDVQSYDRLNIANIYDVQHEMERAEVRKLKGIEGLKAFDAEHKAKSEAPKIKKASNAETINA